MPFAPVTTVTGPHDPDKPTGPVEPPSDVNDPDYLEMQTIALYLTERTQFMETGKSLIKMGLEAYVELAKVPFYELGGTALGTATEKIAEVIQKAGEIRKFAAEATEAAAEARRLVQEGRQAGKSAEEIAKLEETATEAEKGVEEAGQTATDAEKVAGSAQRRADGARQLDGHRNNLDPQTLDAAKRELAGEVVVINPADGQPFDHVTKVRQEQRGLMNRISQINGALTNPTIYQDSALVADLQEELAQNSKLLDYTEEFVPRL